TTDYGREMRKAVSYFIGDVLTPTDSLVLVSPLKIYNINVTGNKERVIADIENLLEKDCSVYKKKLAAAKKDLGNELKRMNKLFSGALDTDRAGITGYKMIGMFLSTFPRNYLNFRNHFLFPHTNRYLRVMALLKNWEGQRWWVHVQEGEAYGFISRVREVNRKIERYGGSNPLFRQSFSTHLNQLEKQLQLAGSFPSQALIDILLAGDTRFNAILVGNQKGSTGGEAGVVSQLGGILNRIARDTGGKRVHTVNPERGMQELTNHKDHFYRLVYRFDNKIEDKSTRVTGNGKTFKFLYNYTVKKDRLQNRVQYLNGKR
ncbi:MAG: hypothetical protein GY940_31130, partial [bacterium]|nr:hypothetical protein [bacterium]